MASNLEGTFPARKKDGTLYYRASITYGSKHISLGSYETALSAHEAYKYASRLLHEDIPADYFLNETHELPLPFSKLVMLVNLRDNGIYCKGPIYLRSNYFDYYLDAKTVLRFSADELFYYTNHSIQRRGGHLFVADYGSQLNILGRYGIPGFAVKNKDYYFKNGDESDFRSGNIVIVNRYHGVRRLMLRGHAVYIVKIHLTGSLIVGRYSDETDAAIAYNKAADVLRSKGYLNNFNQNYIEELSDEQYRTRYDKVKISKKIVEIKKHD
ncbi:MAG: hypothetical protein K6G81_10710 [Lachnospiraceae bacterium]|nr:hypothetical protein [Lachnospiraceae bacterium]